MAFGVALAGDAFAGYQIQVTDANTVGDKIRITREDQDGHYSDVVVRGADMADTAAGTIIYTDYEAPFNTELKYLWEIFDSTDLTTSVDDGEVGPDTTDAPLGFVLVTQVSDPDIMVSGGVVELTEWQNPGRIRGTHYVLGRRNPVVITDVQGGRTGSIVMTNLNISEVDYDGDGPYDAYTTVPGQWSSIFAAGETLLFRNTWSDSGFDDCYLQVTNVTSTRLSRVLGTETDPIFQYNITYVEVDRPRSDLLASPSGGDTWQDLLDNNATWQQVLDTHSTWLDVLTNPTA